MNSRQIKKRKDFFLIGVLCIFGFTIWLFPKSLDSVQFLGFSDPFFIYKENSQSGERDVWKIRQPSAISDKNRAYFPNQ